MDLVKRNKLRMPLTARAFEAIAHGFIARRRVSAAEKPAVIEMAARHHGH